MKEAYIKALSYELYPVVEPNLPKDRSLEDIRKLVQEDKREESKKELDDYSEGVKRRIAKLTKKMRESERREEAATIYAKSVVAEKEALSSRLAKLDTGLLTRFVVKTVLTRSKSITGETFRLAELIKTSSVKDLLPGNSDN